jgi:hypothetical protein
MKETNKNTKSGNKLHPLSQGEGLTFSILGGSDQSGINGEKF